MEKECKLVKWLAEASKCAHADEEDQFKFAPMEKKRKKKTTMKKQECIQFDDTNTLLMP